MLKKEIENELIKKAQNVLKNSHSPNSKFKVGAAILTEKGNIYSGTNVEFDAYTLTVCAERSALFNAVACGDKKLVSIAIATKTADFKFPCGLCRQALVEFNPELEIILVNKSNKTKRIILK